MNEINPDFVPLDGFFKRQDDFILHGPNFVRGPFGLFDLFREEKDTYEYPVEGWYWFDSEEEACQFFGLPYVPREVRGNLYLGMVPPDYQLPSS
jgi:hypothetical protein